MTTILHVEDDESTRALVKELVKKDYNYVGFDNVESALSWLKNNNPDIVILDLRLRNDTEIEGEFSSIKILNYLKKSNSKSRIIILSALSERSKSIMKKYQGYVKAVVHKPFRSSDLINALKKASG